MNYLTPVPPKYETNLKEALAHPKLLYTRSPVCAQSDEYKQIVLLLSDSTSLQNINIERIANPTLYSQFNARRLELLKIKSRDEEALKLCGLSNDEIDMRVRHTTATLGDYSDNCALLFHGTKTNLNAVLSEGLDNRKANINGCLGPGIYFSDSINVSLGFDKFNTLLIYQVLLGDCLKVDQNRQFSREPEKEEHQKRNKFDLFFDSVASRNMFVIFNATQCFPLYAVSYTTRISGNMTNSEEPPFLWPILQSKTETWKFDSRKVFGEME
ncbi:hypothetical protein HK100_009726 [Physocladia obscura]|uniref:PARP catalytic domain-containing protein n=1 Tax=Physocladia obscura TaxID=109957 RepID=A0AAD5SM47_9FUNG|nr:hypothetical protein HK100_009726 [Physocladia obscura]